MNIKEKIFLNECKISDWMKQSEKDFRLNANKILGDIIDNDELFNGLVFNIEYFLEGVGSVVAKVVSNEKELVVKITDVLEKTLAEALSFREWKKVGISTPNIYSEGITNDYYFFVIDYFDEETLLDKIKNREKDISWIFDYMGEVFVKMQNTKGIGFGLPFYDKNKKIIGPILEIDDYLESEFIKEKFSVLDEYSKGVILGDIVREKVERLKMKIHGSESELFSFDFGPRHFFATETPTLFDPDPMLVPKGFGVANLMMPSENKLKDNLRESSAVVSSYVKNGGFFDIEIVSLSLWLQTYRKAAFLLLLPDEERKERALFMIEYLINEEKMDNYVSGFINK